MSSLHIDRDEARKNQNSSFMFYLNVVKSFFFKKKNHVINQIHFHM